MEAMNELGFYTLAGAPRAPRDLIEEVQDAETLGLGSAFVSERWNVKEAATLCGAAGAASTRLGIATAAANHNTRHPAVTLSFATTMHRLTGGRFALGLGRGIDLLFRAFGIPAITNAQVEDFVGLARRLWRGETVVGHDGPSGRWPVLRRGLRAQVLAQLDLGADTVILHGALPRELAPVVEAYRKIRPAGRFDRLPANPGGPLRAG